MRKKYKCRLSATSLLIRVKDKVMRLELEPSVLSEFGLRGCAYTTDNADIQHAIEHCDRFRSGRRDEIWTDDIEPVAKAVEEPVVEKKVARKGKAKKGE